MASFLTKPLLGMLLLANFLVNDFSFVPYSQAPALVEGVMDGLS